ncbi:MAG: sulfotransferase [Gammaproteobacteria bacterium]
MSKSEEPVKSSQQERSQSAVEYAQQLVQQGQIAQGLHVLDDAGKAAHTKEGLYLRAVCFRQLKDYKAAFAALDALLELAPGHARAFQEVGYNHLSQKNTTGAIKGFAKAVELNSALLSSWKVLQELYLSSGQPALYAEAQNHVRQLEQLPRELQAVRSYLNEGNLVLADQICRHFLKTHKQHVEGMRLLAEIASRHRIIDDAEFILESAVAFEPDHVGARVDYATILLKRQRFEKARDIAAGLVKEHPENLNFKAIFGATELGVGNTDAAIAIMNELEEQSFNVKHTLLSLGHALKTAGLIEEAVAAYQRLYNHVPDYGDAFWSLANTKTYKFTDAEVAHMQKYESDERVAVDDRVHFCFALGKAFEDRKDYVRAFDFYERGNRLHKKALEYSIPAIDKRVDRQISVCTRELLDVKRGVGAQAADPIFIVGLPRAGSTLLEQILASHSKVDGTLELPNILSLTRRLRGRVVSASDDDPQYPRILAELEDSYFERFGEQYLNDTQVFRQGAAYFIDKMPNNFLHIGLIKLILPNAKIIDARRHPMSCCFSGFKQLFGEGQEFTYGLSDIGDYYREYVRVMDHWDDVLPGFVLRVQHEDVINDLESQVRRMLDFCGLEFEQSCVDFHKTERNVRTPSSEQVRQPIFKSSMEHWRHFEDRLQPLKDALGPDVLARYPL